MEAPDKWGANRALNEALSDLFLAFEDVFGSDQIMTRSIWFQKFFEDSAAGSAGGKYSSFTKTKSSLIIL